MTPGSSRRICGDRVVEDHARRNISLAVGVVAIIEHENGGMTCKPGTSWLSSRPFQLYHRHSAGANGTAGSCAVVHAAAERVPSGRPRRRATRQRNHRQRTLSDQLAEIERRDLPPVDVDPAIVASPIGGGDTGNSAPGTRGGDRTSDRNNRRGSPQRRGARHYRRPPNHCRRTEWNPDERSGT